MKKSKSESSFSKPIDESKDLKIEDLKKSNKDEAKTIKKTSSKWSCCIFYQSEQEETIDISLKPDFRCKKK